MKDATEFSNAEIVKTCDETYTRLCMAIDMLYVGGALSGELADKMKQNISVLDGAVNVLAARSLTPEDITG